MFAVQAYYWLPSHSLSVAYRWRCSYWGKKKLFAVHLILLFKMQEEHSVAIYLVINLWFIALFGRVLFFYFLLLELQNSCRLKCFFHPAVFSYYSQWWRSPRLIQHTAEPSRDTARTKSAHCHLREELNTEAACWGTKVWHTIQQDTMCWDLTDSFGYLVALKVSGGTLLVHCWIYCSSLFS